MYLRFFCIKGNERKEDLFEFSKKLHENPCFYKKIGYNGEK